ncbi:hypothetical protein ACX818_001406 [Acinetobacter baumannii]
MSLLKIEMDLIVENVENPMEDIADLLHENGLINVKQEIVSQNGPAGWPVFRFTGTKAELEKLVEITTGGNEELETFLIS